MPKEKKGPGLLSTLIDFFAALADKIIEKSDFELEKIKHRVVHYLIVYGLFAMAIVFLIIGLIKYLVDLGIFASEGIGFLIAGCVMIVILAAYSLIRKM